MLGLRQVQAWLAEAKNFQTALTEAKAALDGHDYGKASMALAIKPGDRAAASLRKDAEMVMDSVATKRREEANGLNTEPLKRLEQLDNELKVWEVIFDSKARGRGIDYREVMYSAGSRPFKFMQSIGEAKQVGDRVKVVDNPTGADYKVYVRGLVEQLQGDYGELLDQGRQLRFKKLQERIADQGR